MDRFEDHSQPGAWQEDRMADKRQGYVALLYRHVQEKKSRRITRRSLLIKEKV
jgi:hypothetical protein